MDEVAIRERGNVITESAVAAMVVDSDAASIDGSARSNVPSSTGKLGASVVHHYVAEWLELNYEQGSETNKSFTTDLMNSFVKLGLS